MIFNIPKKAWVRVHDSDADIVELGSAVFPTSEALRNMVVKFFKNDCSGQFRVRLHTTRNYSRVYAASEWANISEITDQYFYGLLRFDFLKDVNLITGKKYYITIQSQGYIRSLNASYMSWIHDYPFPTNISTGNWPNEFPITMEYFNV